MSINGAAHVVADNRVPVFANFMFIWTEEQGSEGLKLQTTCMWVSYRNVTFWSVGEGTQPLGFFYRGFHK